jgi:hypothetical protein
MAKMVINQRQTLQKNTTSTGQEKGITYKLEQYYGIFRKMKASLKK